MMIFIEILVGIFVGFFCCPDIYCDGAVKIHIEDKDICNELLTITNAAIRNHCYDDNFLILLAIHKAENGKPGKEFGVLHPRCLAQIDKEPNRSLDIQAGWAAATIVKTRERWEQAGRPYDFIDFLGDRYCPASVDLKGNRRWKANVHFFFEKYKSLEVKK